MANHITNIIRYPKEKHEAIVQAVVSEYEEKTTGEKGQTIDFGKIIPVPDDIFQGSLGTKERELYGEKNWYDWNIKNWWTKWNAYGCDIAEGELRFDTAWSSPVPVIVKLSEMFPETEFEVMYADEDIGSNYGHYIISAGVVVRDIDIPNAEKFGCDVKGYDYNEYQKDLNENN